MSRPKRATSLAASILPFGFFMIAGWMGLASVVQTKRDIRKLSKGLDAVEEMDPVERMRQRYSLDSRSRDMGSERVSSLEEELQSIQQSINIHDFDYKPVPRPAEEE